MVLDLKEGWTGTDRFYKERLSSNTAGSIGRSVSMPDMLDLNETAFAALMPEQRLMAAIIRRAVADLPISRRFFDTDNGMFQLCCEALGMDPDKVRAQIAKKLKTNAKQMWRVSSASAV